MSQFYKILYANFMTKTHKIFHKNTYARGDNFNP